MTLNIRVNLRREVGVDGRVRFERPIRTNDGNRSAGLISHPDESRARVRHCPGYRRAGSVVYGHLLTNRRLFRSDARALPEPNLLVENHALDRAVNHGFRRHLWRWRNPCRIGSGCGWLRTGS